jgi:hypothetical protein
VEDVSVRVLLVTKGHPFAREPFLSIFDDAPGIEWTHVEQPAAEALLDPGAAARWDVLVFYDMPGIRFTGSDPPVELQAPPAALVRGFEASSTRARAWSSSTTPSRGGRRGPATPR